MLYLKHGVLTLLTAALAVLPARGGVISSYNAGNFVFGTDGVFAGQQFTTSSGGPWNGITFNFFSDFPNSTAYAIGTAYLFDQAYSGTPADLASATTGLLGTASASAGVYAFTPSLTLSGDTSYFLYEDTPIPGGTIFIDVVGSGLSLASDSASDFAANPATADFSVSGTLAPATTVPEPGTWTLFLVGAAGLRAWTRRPRRSHARA